MARAHAETPGQGELSLTVQSLFERRLRGEANGAFSSQAIARCPQRGAAPLSFAQQRLWFLHQLEPESAAYNRPLGLRLVGPLNVTALKRALGDIVHRHEVVRTVYQMVDGQPRQVVTAPQPIALSWVDLSSVPIVRRAAEALRLAGEEARRPFDLTQVPLLRATLFRLGDEEHILLVTFHHIAFDGWSQHVFERELAVLYEACALGLPSPLPELTIQYADYAAWQREWLRGRVLDEQMAYWKQQLAGSPPALDLPVDHQRPAVQEGRGAQESLGLPVALAEAIRALGQREGATLFMTLLAAFKVLLQRYSGQDDIVVGTPIAGRTRLETEGLIGCFINMLALRTGLSGSPTFRELLRRVREVALGAYAHQELPFEKLVEELQPERHLNRTPLFQPLFNMRNTPQRVVEMRGLEVEGLTLDSGIAAYDMALEVVERGGALRCLLQYDIALFEAATVRRLLGHYRTLLESIVANPDQPISALPILPEAERQQLPVAWNDTRTDYPRDQCLHQLFEAQVERNPNATALVFEGRQMTYGELNARANQLAHHLQTRGVGPETLVGICVERSLEMVVGLLGILKAGGAYLPLDPSYPKERLAFMLQDARVPVIVTQQRLSEVLPPHEAQVVSLDRDRQPILQESTDNPPNRSSGDNLAYVIFTSGSTGRPKGVMVSHRNVARLFSATKAWFGFDEHDVWTLFHSYAFDFSTWEIWGALLHGGKLVVVPYWVSRSPKDFCDLLCAEQVTVLNQTPSAFRHIIRAEQSRRSSGDLALRLVIFGGEALELESLRPWLDRHGDQHPQLVNMYGITETTVHVTYRPLSIADLEHNHGSPIGAPIPDLYIRLLDEKQRIVPMGTPGEICVGGAGLARGYLNRPELTAERFIADPYCRSEGRLYKSGDLARCLPNRDLEYLGRIDQQVKIRGYRVEPGEIEATLFRHPDVCEAAVVAREDTPGDKRLVAYVVAQSQQAPTPTELRSFLRERLPEYMVPAAFVMLDTLPLNPSQKMDRRALPAPNWKNAGPREASVAPRTPVEARLAEIWADVLGLEQVGIEDSFFALGGHSLAAAQVIGRVRDAFKVELPLRRLFEQPTIAGLAIEIVQALADQAEQVSQGRERLDD